MGTQMGVSGWRETHETISAAALGLFGRDGYEHTTVDAIARAAGVSRATVFRCFPSKEEILFARHPAEVERLRLAVRARAGSDEGQALRRALLECAGRLEADPAFGVEVALMVAHPRLLARALVTLHIWAEGLAAELAAGRGQATVDLRAKVLAHAAMSALQEAICVWCAGEAGPSLVRLAGDALRVALPTGTRTKK